MYPTDPELGVKVICGFVPPVTYGYVGEIGRPICKLPSVQVERPSIMLPVLDAFDPINSVPLVWVSPILNGEDAPKKPLFTLKQFVIAFPCISSPDVAVPFHAFDGPWGPVLPVGP